MKTYVITGYSDKLDGIVYVTKATDKVEALRSFLRAMNDDVEKGEKWFKLALLLPEDGYDGPQLALAPVEYKDKYNSRWNHLIEVGEVGSDGFAQDSVQW